MTLIVIIKLNSKRKSEKEDPYIIFRVPLTSIMPANIEIDTRGHIINYGKVVKPSIHIMVLRSHTLRNKQFQKLVKQLACEPVVIL